MSNFDEIKNDTASLPSADGKSDGIIEHEFTVGIPKTALVFEDGDTPEEEEVMSSSEPTSPPVEPATSEDSLPEEFDIFSVEETSSVETEAPLRSAGDEEFDIPDSLFFGEDTLAPTSDDGTPLIWTTYVPRFTEASEKTYTFVDEEEMLRRENIKRAIIDGAGKGRVEFDPEEGASETRKTEKNVVAEEGVAIGEEKSTAEIDSADDLSEAVVVKINGEPEETHDAISVFKFGDDEKEAAPEPSAEELERESISALTGHVFETEEKTGEDVADAADAEPAYEPVSEERTRREIPHPARPFKEVYSAPADDELPESERPKGYGRTIDVTAKGGSEYTYFTQREKFKDRFLDSLMSVRVRLTVAALLAALIFVFENLSLFISDFYTKIGLEGLLSRAVIDVILVLGMLLLAIPEIIRGLSQLKSGRIAPELSLVLSAAVIVAYTAVIAASPVGDITFLPLGSVYAVNVISAIISTHSLVCADFTAFKTVSEKGDKRVVDVRNTRTLDRENMALDGAVDEASSAIARDFKTGFVADFFKNCGKRAENHKNNALIFALTYGVAIVLGLVMFFIDNGIVSLLSAAALTVCLATPAFALLSHKVPYGHSQRELSDSNSAVMGESALLDAVGVDVVAFRDTEIFGEDDVVFKSISLSNKDGDFRRAMKMMSQLFGALGGPLKRMFSASIGKEYPPAQRLVIEADGACGVIDGVSVMAGSAEYMRRKGISVPRESGFSLASTRTMYAAESGVLFAKFSIQYSFSEEFAHMLSALKEENIVPLVYTRDPNVNNELMRFLTGDKDCIRVMKKQSVAPAEEKVYPALEAGLATLGDKTDVVNMLLLSKRYSALQSGIALTELAASLVGEVLAALIVICNMTSALPSALIAIWQVAWCVALFVISRRSFKFRRRKKK